MFKPDLISTSLHVNKSRLCGVVEGAEPFVVQAREALRQQQSLEGGCQALVIVRDGERLDDMVTHLTALCPEKEILPFPAWDTVPYDRASPRKDLVGQRVKTLEALSHADAEKGQIIVTSSKALCQKVPPRSEGRFFSLSLEKGKSVSFEGLQSFLQDNGYLRVETVREPGEYAIRGGLVDLFPSGHSNPLRLDLFGDEIESLTSFDPLSQRSLDDQTEGVTLIPAGEVILSEEKRRCFREKYRRLFDTTGEKDPLYQAISAGRSYPGMEHWLSLFYPSLVSLTSYLNPGAHLYWCHQSEGALQQHWEQIEDHYQARLQGHQGNNKTLYYPVPPQDLFLTRDELSADPFRTVFLTPFSEPETRPEESEKTSDAAVIDLASKSLLMTAPGQNAPSMTPGERFRRLESERDFYDKATLVLGGTEGDCHRAKTFLETMDIQVSVLPVSTKEQPFWSEKVFSKSQRQGFDKIRVGLFPLSQSFETPSGRFIATQDLFGRRQGGRPKRKRRSDLFIEESSALTVGDLVVHDQHGVGRYAGLHTLLVDRIPHDCLQLVYAGDDKLFLPVENLDLMTRFGGEDREAALDKLGSQAWQKRRQKVKEDLMVMASQLIELAATRQIRTCESLVPDEAFYQEFVSRFPYAETEDQQQAIQDCLEDFRKGVPMDRLICGDVGYGKTEVALRAAAVMASTGKQVALVAPTTLLARQHYLNFSERFQGLGVEIAQLSRFVPPKKAKQVKEDLKTGRVAVVVGTHALLSPKLGFQDLGLVIVDEEQHFGVKQKEYLKNLKTDVHVLTLSATPIPRTLQLSLSGVRDMSLITTPPVDRLSVHTFVIPFDGVIVKEAIEREMYRGGQIFFVCPRIRDIEECRDTLLSLVPTLKIAIATGQMSARELEDVMVDFYEKKYDLLLSTNIIESGLDLPSVNTIFVHRSDLFGLSQLYQLRGRVGRGKTRGYAYLTTPVHQTLAPTSQKRLEVMQTLDTLGAGFKLASHDMDLRGAGNLLGDAQSGHVKEVGVELYQQMLEDAVTAAKSRQNGEAESVTGQEKWTPQLNLGLAVLIPEAYVTDLSVRLTLYRRLSWSQNEEDLGALTAEMVDRFGPLPPEVENLLVTVRLKQLCRQAGVSKVDVGPKGATFFFYQDSFQKPESLIQYVMSREGVVQLRPDQSLVYLQAWATLPDRLHGVEVFLKDLVALCTSE